MKNNTKAQKVLKILIEGLWYGGLTAAFLFFLAIIIFDLSVIGIINVKVPTVSVKLNETIYRFNSKFIEVKRLDSIVKDYMREEISKRLQYEPPWNEDAIKNLYDVDFRDISKDGRPHISNRVYNITSEGKWFSIDDIDDTSDRLSRGVSLIYFEHSKHAELVLGLSFLGFILPLLVVIILYNLRKIFRNYSGESTFTVDNSRRLKYIGIYFLLGEILRTLSSFWINNSILSSEKFKGVDMINWVSRLYHFSFSDINFYVLFTGVIFIILSEIFRTGSSMKEELDLTV